MPKEVKTEGSYHVYLMTDGTYLIGRNPQVENKCEITIEDPGIVDMIIYKEEDQLKRISAIVPFSSGVLSVFPAGTMTLFRDRIIATFEVDYERSTRLDAFTNYTTVAEIVNRFGVGPILKKVGSPSPKPKEPELTWLKEGNRKRGYQPPKSKGPEEKNPPEGGSDVEPPRIIKGDSVDEQKRSS